MGIYIYQNWWYHPELQKLDLDFETLTLSVGWQKFRVSIDFSENVLLYIFASCNKKKKLEGYISHTYGFSILNIFKFSFGWFVIWVSGVKCKKPHNWLKLLTIGTWRFNNHYSYKLMLRESKKVSILKCSPKS